MLPVTGKSNAVSSSLTGAKFPARYGDASSSVVMALF